MHFYGALCIYLAWNCSGRPDRPGLAHRPFSLDRLDGGVLFLLCIATKWPRSGPRIDGQSGSENGVFLTPVSPMGNGCT